MATQAFDVDRLAMREISQLGDARDQPARRRESQGRR
jgi:hypothetical protein